MGISTDANCITDSVTLETSMPLEFSLVDHSNVVWFYVRTRGAGRTAWRLVELST